MDDLRQILTDRLIKCGAEPSSLEGVLKALSKLISADPNIDPAAANARMSYLGWQEVHLDYHILQLALACFELEHLGGGAPFIQDETRRQALRLRELESGVVAASEP